MTFYDKEDSTLKNALETDVKTTSHDEHQTKWNTASLNNLSWRNVRKIDIDKEESFPPLDLRISPPFYSYPPFIFLNKFLAPLKAFWGKSLPIL